MAAPSRPWKPLNAPETSLPSFTIFYHLLPSFTIFYHLYPKLSHFLKTQLFYCFSVSDVDTMPRFRNRNQTFLIFKILISDSPILIPDLPYFTIPISILFLAGFARPWRRSLQGRARPAPFFLYGRAAPRSVLSGLCQPRGRDL